MINRWKLYDLIYNKADKLFEEYNPCNIRVKDNVLICNNKYMCKKYGKDLCCSGCRYLGEKGCTIKCLSCKVGMCWEGHTCETMFKKDLSHINIPKVFIHKIDRLKRIAYKYQLSFTRTSKEDVFAKQLITI